MVKREKQLNRLLVTLKDCNNEEEVKKSFLDYFDQKLNALNGIDHYTPEILFEFKHNWNLKNVRYRACAIAQTMYYVRRLKYGVATVPVPPLICVIDKNEGFFVSTSEFSSFYNASAKYDWDRAPSDPCPVLVKALSSFDAVKNIHVFSFENEHDESLFVSAVSVPTQQSFFEDTKKVISEENFTAVYTYWESLFGKYVKNGHKPSEYFISDIEYGQSQIIGNNEVLFRLNDGTVSKNVPMKEYKYFWDIYEKISDSTRIQALRQKTDRLTEDFSRRFTGEFYTPISFAQKAFDYLERTVGKVKLQSGKWRIWDMAAGTGNLEFVLPSSIMKNCYISTLLEDDAAYCKKIYPYATVFQYDYLNDDAFRIANPGTTPFGVAPKLPPQLIADLEDPEISWIIFINPPFATSNKADTNLGKESKTGVSATQIRKLMTDADLGEVSRELFSQFLYRISVEFKGRTAYLGLFSTIKYLVSNNDQKLRDSFFQYKFERGFVFPSKAFEGTKGNFPVGFLVWNLKEQIPLSNQKIVLDVYNTSCEKTGTKTTPTISRNDLLSKWVPRPKNKDIFPALSSAIKITERTIDVRDGIADGFICSLMCCGNDMQHQNYVAILSGPYASAGGFSVVPANFEKSMVVHAVRKIPKATWLNDRDQFYQPVVAELPKKFTSDCVIWSAFSQSNNSVSMKDVRYKKKVYQIENELFPFLLSTVKNWNCDLRDIQNQLYTANENRYMAKWIKDHQPFSLEAQKVLDAAKELYQYVYAHLSETNWPDYKIQCWDLGWWQVRKAAGDLEEAEPLLAAVRGAENLLAAKLEEQISLFGFMPPAVQPLPSAVLDFKQMEFAPTSNQ